MDPEIIAKHMLKPKIIVGKHVIITAGPNIEVLDPMCYLSNYSPGKMGYTLVGVFLDVD